jgi:hypothetical protein
MEEPADKKINYWVYEVFPGDKNYDQKKILKHFDIIEFDDIHS